MQAVVCLSKEAVNPQTLSGINQLSKDLCVLGILLTTMPMAQSTQEPPELLRVAAADAYSAHCVL